MNPSYANKIILIDCKKPMKFYDMIHDVQRHIIYSALEDTNFVVKEAAKRLSMNRTTLVEMINRLGIEYPKWRKSRKKEDQLDIFKRIRDDRNIH